MPERTNNKEGILEEILFDCPNSLTAIAVGENSMSSCDGNYFLSGTTKNFNLLCFRCKKWKDYEPSEKK